MPIMLVTSEAEIGRIAVPSPAWAISYKTSSPKLTKAKMD
jgi:hypothetical protein